MRRWNSEKGGCGKRCGRRLSGGVVEARDAGENEGRGRLQGFWGDGQV